MLYAVLALIAGLVLLVWSADRFIDGASATARHFGMSPLLIGMVIVGFGTSAPEMVVSVLAAMDNSPGIALGNAYGSNITNIALILGVTALISPIAVQKQIVRTEMPMLLGVTALAAWQLWDGMLSLTDGIVLLVMLAAYMTWTIWQNLKGTEQLAAEYAEELDKTTPPAPLYKSIFWLVLGLVLLVLSSRLLVWGAVTIAKSLGVSDLIIGLTVVAVGTSLPELASSIAAARKGEHEIALGNVIGSNMFNTLAVVGLAAVIHPLQVTPEILNRDIAIMATLTVLLLIFCIGQRAKRGKRVKWSNGRIGRIKGGVFLAGYLAYTTYLIATSF